MAVILGLTAFHAGASACLVIDGVPIFAIAEERINRVKHYAGFPKLAIKACLDFAGLKIGDIDHVVVGRDPNANLLQKFSYAARNIDKLANIFSIARKSHRFRGIHALVADALEVGAAGLKFRLHNVEHHIAHIASAYYVSAWDKAAGFSVDGSGDFVTGMMADCEGDAIRVIRRTYVPHSLGSLYTMVSQFIGFPNYGDEGKVMGLAAYGTDRFDDRFNDLVGITSRGFELNLRYFKPFGSDQGLVIDDGGNVSIGRQYSDHMIECFGPARDPGDDLSQRDMDLACGLQKKFEEIYLFQANRLHAQVSVPRIAIGGGCALNSVANGRLLEDTPFSETCIQPAAGDDGLAMGSALYVSNAVLKEGRRWVIENAYLGDAFSDSAIRMALERRKIHYAEQARDQLIERTVEHLVAGDVVGWFQGRMEWGPRALGNRSILVHPGFPNMKDILNARIKRREWFRPFAPAVLKERQGEIFEHTHPSPFMLHVFGIKAEWRERLSAVVHRDNTGRLQTVARNENTLYYDLISAFDRRTGIPVILNTSFNENEPIVRTPDEAIDCFLRTRMDVLAIGPYLCVKNAQ